MIRKILVGLLVAAALAWSGAADPFAGLWRLNLAKSNLPPPLPQSQTVRIEVEGGTIRMREEIVNERGEHLIITLEAGFDGRDYPIYGTSQADTVAYERVDERTLRSTIKKSGRVVMKETIFVSADGRTVTGTYSGTDASGRIVTASAVFDRQ
jgi:hypothetical protein